MSDSILGTMKPGAGTRPGHPCWAEMGTTDLDASGAFYHAVFGWTATRDPRAEAGGYTVLKLGDDPVAAVTPLYSPEQPVAWTVSFGTADADATAAAAKAHGGSVIVEPVDVFDEGRFAVLADPVGAVFQTWEPRGFSGTPVFGRTNALGWVELETSDTAGAVTFYTALYGWGVSSSEFYTQWGLDGQDFGGMADLKAMAEMSPGGLEAAQAVPSWKPYFLVEDVDATAAKAEAAGAAMLMPPSDVPGGPRIALFRDPHGAVFGIHHGEM